MLNWLPQFVYGLDEMETIAIDCNAILTPGFPAFPLVFPLRVCEGPSQSQSFSSDSK